MPRSIRRAATSALALAALSLAASAPASAAAPTPGSGDGKVVYDGRWTTVDVSLERFSYRSGRAVAYGTASQRVRTKDGRVRTQSRRVAYAVAAQADCRVITLRLEDLRLNLLGLIVNTSPVNLRVSGDRSKVLGRLFCDLARGLDLKKATKARTAVRSLNRRMSKRPMRMMRFRAALPTATRSQTTQQYCQVLDLILGPLELDLLGLVVELYGQTRKDPVRVVALADPNGGLLGRTLCQITGPPGPAPAGNPAPAT